MRVVPREIELIRPVPEYSQYSETGFFCASNERSSKLSLPGDKPTSPVPEARFRRNENMEFMTGVKKTDLLELPELQDKSLAGQTVKVNGAVHTIRDMGDVAFVVLRKRDGLLQCVYEEGKAGFDLKDLKEAATVEMEGILNEEERFQSLRTHASSHCKMETEHFSGCQA